MKKIYLLTIIALIVTFFIGCGGGGKKGSTVITSKMGQIAPVVSFREVKQIKELQRSSSEEVKKMVKVDIIITGYNKEGLQFTPITASTEIDPTIAESKVRVLNVPIGKNHVVTATANFLNGSTATIKGICEEVFEAKISEVIVNQRTTVITNVALKKAEIEKKKLYEIKWEDIKHIGENVDKMYSKGIAYEDMDIDILVSYDDNIGKPGDIKIKSPQTEVVSGSTIQLDAEVYDKNGDLIDMSVEWSIDGDLGSIDQNGLFTAVKAGNGMIKASVEGISGHFNITVLAGEIEHFWVVPNVVTMRAGENQIFTVVARDKNGNSISGDISWSVIGDIGTIDETGNFIATKNGGGNIKAELKGKTGYSCVSVSGVEYLSALP